MKRIPSLDGFRAISIILVLICHSRYSVGFPSRFVDIARHGFVGVTVFFVISGFLITNLLLTEQANYGKINAGQFYIRRAFRILPVFLLYTFFCLAISNIGNLQISRNNLIHVFTFTSDFDPDINWYVGHFWSLSVEEQFYLIWPLLLIIFRRHLKLTLVILIMYSCLARVFDFKFPAYKLITLSPFFMHTDAILTGALGGVIYFHNPGLVKIKFFKSGLLQILAIMVIVLFTYLSGYGKLAIISLPFSGVFISAAILYIILSNLTPSGNMFYKILNNKVMVHIGILSYSIYVWQQYFVVGAVIWRALPLNLLIIYVISLASYYLCEKPFLKLRKYFSKPTIAIEQA